ncbi:hypothetical protein VTL71DRAFT_11339 [Oculimacula yallundae]|uniref:GST N-terminal domain-containing protein n=1 Tax=Oculimacula yallundae TaxID=86028 RepID=A0ABR4CPV3_9HELO
MASNAEPEIVLYDLSNTKGVCFSPMAWRDRLLLNYKRIPYKTVFLEFQEIGPTVKKFGIAEAFPSDTYTVPFIFHIPSSTYILESFPIAKFIEKTYPERPVQLTSDFGSEVHSKLDPTIHSIYNAVVLPLEIGVLTPDAEAFFRRTREKTRGYPLEDLLAPGKVEQAWKAADDELKAVSELLLTNKDKGPFVLGTEPSYIDFMVAGWLECFKVIDEESFQNVVKLAGFKQIYEACQPFMEKKD